MTETDKRPSPTSQRGRICMRMLNKALVRNPLMGLPRNMRCPCGSGDKFKACCLPLTKEWVAIEALEETRRVLKLALAGEVAW